MSEMFCGMFGAEMSKRERERGRHEKDGYG